MLSRKMVVVALLAAILSVGAVLTASYFTRGEHLALKLDGIQILRYQVVDTQFLRSPEMPGIGNIARTYDISLKISSLGGGAYLVERATNNADYGGPNATFIVDGQGRVRNATFEETKAGDSSIIFEVAEGSSFDFPEILPLPGKRLSLPASWSGAGEFNYTIHTGESVFRTVGSTEIDLNASGTREVVTPAGDFSAIEGQCEKTTSYTTWMIPRDGPITLEDGPTNIRGTGRFMIARRNGILVSCTLTIFENGTREREFKITLRELSSEEG